MSLFSCSSASFHKSNASYQVGEWLKRANSICSDNIDVINCSKDLVESAFSMNERWHTGLFCQSSNTESLVLSALINGASHFRDTSHGETLFTALAIALARHETGHLDYASYSGMDLEMLDTAVKFKVSNADQLRSAISSEILLET